jgi:hypothetical protein
VRTVRLTFGIEANFEAVREGDIDGSKKDEIGTLPGGAFGKQDWKHIRSNEQHHGKKCPLKCHGSGQRLLNSHLRW